MSGSNSSALRLGGLAAALALGLLLPGCDRGGETGPSATLTPAATTDGSTAPAARPISSAAPTPVAAPAPAPAPVAAPASYAGPRGRLIEFEKPEHDYGPIWDLGSWNTRFAFRNIGSSDLRILAVKPGCGCTATTLTKTTYAPGEVGEIGVVFSPTGTGIQRKKITVVTNDPGLPTFDLHIAANIRQLVSAEPRIVRFETVPLGESRTQRVLVQTASPGMTVTSVTTSGQHPDRIRARLVEGETTLNGRQGIAVVEIEVPNTLEWGAVYATAQVHSHGPTPEGETVDHVADVIVAASVYGDIHADDNMVRVGVVKPGDPYRHAVTFTSPTGRPFALLEAVVEAPTLPTTAQIEQIDARTWRVWVAGQTGTFLGPFSGMLVVRTDDPDEPELRLRVAGYVRDVTKG